MTLETRKPVHIFYSYIEEDEPFLNKLENQLTLLKKMGVVTSWYKRKVEAGIDIPTQIDAHLNSAELVLLLISAKFLASDYYSVEIQQVMEKYNAGQAQVIPILLRPVNYKGAPFDKLQVLPKNGTAISLWRNQDQAFYEIAREIITVVEAIYGYPSADSLAPVGSNFIGSEKKSSSLQLDNIPFEPNPFFTGREDVLQSIRESLTHESAVALTQTQVISGLGGIGKTQTAIQYIYLYRNAYQLRFWIRAETESSIQTSFIEIAKSLKLPIKNIQNPDNIVDSVKNWLENTDSWILVFDNADHPELIKRFRPRNPKGHILLTSRAQVFDVLGISTAIEIKEMTPDEAFAFLFKRTGRNEEILEERQAAADLAYELGYLPLALEQCCAHIAANSTRFQDYLKSYRRRSLELLNESQPKVGDYPSEVAATWAMNFREVKEVPEAADLLCASAFLNPASIPLELIIKGASQLGQAVNDALSEVHNDPLLLDEVLEPLIRYSLIRRDTASHTFTIHRLVQEVIKHTMDVETRRLWAERVVKAVNTSLPQPGFEAWTTYERLLPHAQNCILLIKSLNFVFEEGAQLLSKIGRYLQVRTQYIEAKPILEQALAIREQNLGPEYIETSTSLVDLGILYEKLGRYEDAEPYLERALKIRERVLGPDHPDTAMTLNALGFLYHQQGKDDLAERLSKRALEIQERALGSEHPETIRYANNLAWLYQSRNEYEKAEPLLRNALTAREKVLGPEHPETAISLKDLGLLHYRQGKYKQAEQRYQQALEVRKKVFGTEHADTAASLNDLASLYQSTGKHEQAEQLLQQALEIREKMLGIAHPDTIHNLNSLGWLYQDMGQDEKAVQHLQQALSIREKELGPEHRAIATSLNDLAWLYQKQGKYKQAEPLLRRALLIRETVLGPEHLETAVSLKDSGLLYHKQGKHQQAKIFFRRALIIRKKVLGSEHIDTITSINDLAWLFQSLGDYARAESLFKQALKLREKVLGSEHLETISSLKDLGVLYLRQGRNEEAEPLLIRALETRENILDSGHPDIATSLNDLAWLRRNQGKYKEAEKLLQQALEIRKKVLKPEHPELAFTLHDLGLLRHRQAKYKQAENFYRDALHIRKQKLGLEHPETAISLLNLGLLYLDLKKYEQAGDFLQRAVLIHKKVLGLMHPDTLAASAKYDEFLKRTEHN